MDAQTIAEMLKFANLQMAAEALYALVIVDRPRIICLAHAYGQRGSFAGVGDGGALGVLVAPGFARDAQAFVGATALAQGALALP